VLTCKRFQAGLSTACELEVDQTAVDRIAIALEQATGLGTLAEFDSAVMAHVQLLRDVCDARRVLDRVTANREQQLV
jgi:hypothetical protein